MKLLLDTHTLLWLLTGSADFSRKAREAVADTGNEKLLSVGSLWEITIKVSKERLEFDRPLADFLTWVQTHPQIQMLPIRPPHLLWLATLPHHHRDPFDRLIVAQALSEECTLVSRDTQLDAYGVSRLW